MNILVTGGAGYIGSHACRKLLKKAHAVYLVDNFSHSKLEQLSGITSGTCSPQIDYYFIDLADHRMIKYLSHLIQSKEIDVIMHFASFIEVGESVTDPLKYYSNNVPSMITLLKAMEDTKCNKIIFSSTAAVYGNPVSDKITEDHPTNPINPYGRTKLYAENILKDVVSLGKIGAVVFRYFNVAGVTPDGCLHECHEPETHLIPKIFQAAKENKPIWIYGEDFPTEDGTCIRDYVHVDDLIDAHILGINSIIPGQIQTYNIGSQTGYSVKEVIYAVEKRLGKKLDVRIGERRAGDPPKLVADSSLIQEKLNWSPIYKTIDNIIEHIV